MNRRTPLAFSPGAAGPLLRPEPEATWRDYALCSEVGGDEIWFPEKGGSTKTAKAICRRCEVEDECLEYALATDQNFGIWGGTSVQDRERLKAQRQLGKAA